jgi:type IV pilus assembly protein PilC
MKFTYTATKDDKTIHGSAEATDRTSLVATLNRQGLKPLVIKAEGGNTKKQRGKKVKLKDLVVFTRQMSTMVSAGVPLTRAIATLQLQTENKYFKKVCAGIMKDVESGLPLADAFAKYPSVFSEVYVNMVRAGEAGGILDEILKRLASQVEQDSSMRKKIKSAMTYPVVILGITVIAFFGLMLGVIPKLGKILKELGGENATLPSYTQALIDISNFCLNATIIPHVPNALFILIAAVVIIFFLKRYIKTPSGKFKFHKLLLKIPVVKTILTKIAIARFSRTFASLMSSGVGVLDAIEVTGGAIGNKVIEADLRAAAAEVKAGKQLSEPLSRSKYFPAIVAQMLAIGEETGQMDTILIKVADFYEEEVSTTLDGLTSIIEPVMIVVLGSMVGLVAASVMGPIANLSKNIQ